MADLYYRQCKLEREAPLGGRTEMVSWIPERHKDVRIKPGVSVTLIDADTKTESPEFWTVVSIGDQRIPENRIKEQARNWAKWRAQTDI